MMQKHVPEVPNRIGRIVIATILAGLLVTLISLAIPSESLSMSRSLLGLFIDTLFYLAINTVLVGFVVLPALVFYWLLSRRYSPVRCWQTLLSLTVIIATLWPILEARNDFGYVADEPLAYTLEVVVLVFQGGAILLAIAVTEGVFSSSITNDLTPQQTVTAGGGIFLAFLVLVPVAVAGAGVLGATGDAVGLGDDDEVRGMDVAELESEFEPLLAVESGDELVCGPVENVTRRDAPLAAHTYENDLSDFGVEPAIVEHRHRTSYRIQLALEHNDEYLIQSYRAANVRHDGNVTVSSRSLTNVHSETMTLTAIDGRNTYLSTEDGTLEYRYLEIDVVNDDGEVIRYTGRLCDPT